MVQRGLSVPILQVVQFMPNKQELAKFYDIQLEQALLGCLLFNSEDLVVRVLELGDLVVDDFYEPLHSKIYEKILINSNNNYTELDILSMKTKS